MKALSLYHPSPPFSLPPNLFLSDCSLKAFANLHSRFVAWLRACDKSYFEVFACLVHSCDILRVRMTVRFSVHGFSFPLLLRSKSILDGVMCLKDGVSACNECGPWHRNRLLIFFFNSFKCSFDFPLNFHLVDVYLNSFQ